jgi:hypothetical protein
MLELKEIVKRLQDRNSTMVSHATGLHLNTILAIKAGKNENPTRATMVLLSEYLNPSELPSNDQ